MNIFPALAALGVTVALANADDVFRGFDSNPGVGVPPPPYVNSDAARAAFSAAAGGATATQDFESLPVGPVASPFNVGPVSTTFTNLSDIGSNVRNTQFFDAFATSGVNYVYSEVSEGVAFWTLGFGTPLTGAGFTHTDAMDWLGVGGVPSLQVILDRGLASERVFDLLTEDPATIPSGSVGFFGVITDDPFSTLTVFRPVGGGNTDALGLDDLTVVIPAPSALSLIGVTGIAGARRRR